MTAAPRPWTFKTRESWDGTGVYYIRIFDANGRKVTDLTPHESAGGQGLEVATATARLIVALANSPAADDFEARLADTVEIPPAEQPPIPIEARLL